jgi:hypothetical protein
MTMTKKQPAKATKKAASPKAAAPAPPAVKKETAPKVEKATVTPSTTAQPADPRLPAAGTTIQKRDRHGAVRCECKVEDGGIWYAGKVHSSLSGAAMAAAKDLGLKNKTQNGFIFWGLVKPPRPASDPIEGLELAWRRYRERAEAIVKVVTEENRSRIAASIGTHAQVIEKLASSPSLKGASVK